MQRNFQEALAKAGFVKKFACDADACGRAARIQEPFIGYSSTMKQIESYGGYSDMAFTVLNAGTEPHYIWGTLKNGGRDVVVSIFLTPIGASDDSPLKNRIGVFIETVEPKAMETGQVTVDAGAMKKGLAADGKIALYGVYFDTGKADVKPESKPQLDEMAKLLDADKAIRVFIVGHTDNQGAIDANVALSQRRRSDRRHAGARLPDRPEASRREGRGEFRAGREQRGGSRSHAEPTGRAGATVTRHDGPRGG